MGVSDMLDVYYVIVDFVVCKLFLKCLCGLVCLSGF